MPPEPPIGGRWPIPLGALGVLVGKVANDLVPLGEGKQAPKHRE